MTPIITMFFCPNFGQNGFPKSPAQNEERRHHTSRNKKKKEEEKRKSFPFGANLAALSAQVRNPCHVTRQRISAANQISGFIA